MIKHSITRILSLALILTTLLSLSGCSRSAQSANLMKGVKVNTANFDIDLKGDDLKSVADFTVSLFKRSTPSEKNALISPLSVLCALSMTANGAKSETLAQMENAFGLSVPELNNYLHSYLNSLSTGSKYKLSIANSIWFKDDKSLTVEKDFLQKNADYYNTAIYKSAFDKATLKDINTWVSDNTDSMVRNILDKLSEDAVMYLINALAFDAEWENIYQKYQVRDGIFTTESGEAQAVKMMNSAENRYLDDGNATGFIKYYADRRYAFAALLPNEGLSAVDYIETLTGDNLISTLNNAQDTEVTVAIPSFESEYTIEMSSILTSMGMTDAFSSEAADFTGLARSEKGNIYISRVLHKTFIAVDERGTKAGAATVVEMNAGSALMKKEPKTVFLDRPFVYMLIDCDTNLPIFIGTMMDTGK